MLLAEFIRRTGFTPNLPIRFPPTGRKPRPWNALPECFTDGFFERYAEKLAVPTPFAPELPELNARVAAEPALRVYANLIIDAAFRRDEPGLGKWPAPEKLLTRRQCGLFQLLMAMSALPLIAASYRQIGCRRSMRTVRRSGSAEPSRFTPPPTTAIPATTCSRFTG